MLEMLNFKLVKLLVRNNVTLGILGRMIGPCLTGHEYSCLAGVRWCDGVINDESMSAIEGKFCDAMHYGLISLISSADVPFLTSCTTNL